MALPGARYIVIEGPIGVGKTSLARRLAERLNAFLLPEQAEENPFLANFYQDPKRYALPTQMFFLLQRARQLEILRQGDLFQPLTVSDFMWEKDRIFAALTLSDDELALYDQVHNALQVAGPAPDLVVYLHAPVKVLLNRIRRRGFAYEQGMQVDYLQKLLGAYNEFFHYYNGSPLLSVNVENLDFVHQEDDFAMLFSRIQGIKAGRHYFNPRMEL